MALKHAEKTRIALIFWPTSTQFVKNNPHKALRTTGSSLLLKQPGCRDKGLVLSVQHISATHIPLMR